MTNQQKAMKMRSKDCIIKSLKLYTRIKIC